MRPLLPATFVRLHAAINGRSRGIAAQSWNRVESIADGIEPALAALGPMSKELAKQLRNNGRVHSCGLCGFPLRE